MTTDELSEELKEFRPLMQYGRDTDQWYVVLLEFGYRSYTGKTLRAAMQEAYDYIERSRSHVSM